MTTRLETKTASLHLTTYIHATILKPGPNVSRQPNVFRGLFWCFVFESAAALVVMAGVYVWYHWKF
jgi:hypothetical protein